MTQWNALLPVVGPVVAALIAGAVAFLASVLSKELKTSEFRQAWIDALRGDIAEAVSLHLLLQDILATEIREKRSLDAIKTALRDKQDDYGRMEAAIARTRLRLNPTEHETLIGLIRQLGTPVASLKDGKTTESDHLGERVLEETQKVLKGEWARVKRGERIFVVTKWAALVLVATAAVAATILIARNWP